MNKRIAMAGLIILLALFPLAAAVGTVSVTGLYTLSSGTETLTSFDYESKASDIAVKVQGTSYFSQTSPFGLSYMASGSKRLSASMNGVSNDPGDEPWAWAFGVGGTVRIRKGTEMSFEVGAGVEYSIASRQVLGTLIDLRQAAATGYGQVNYELLHHILLSTGVSVRYPLWGESRSQVGGITVLGAFDSTVLSFAPYVGLSFEY